MYVSTSFGFTYTFGLMDWVGRADSKTPSAVALALLIMAVTLATRAVVTHSAREPIAAFVYGVGGALCLAGCIWMMVEAWNRWLTGLGQSGIHLGGISGAAAGTVLALLPIIIVTGIMRYVGRRLSGAKPVSHHAITPAAASRRPGPYQTNQ
ncbi:hypothetical protein QFZ36_002243 [Pseudarthrobacter siccitolerans]|uniref:Uncharacterized protein n=1 Tax=Pseudarthrobacter siccitolerans TaxID=861266 RepID=A0ABU0PL40_9MICC|nr:hypothetical protein [Pseudarthrobacter siccitolerans]